MNTTELIAAVRRTGSISQNDPVYTDTAILDELTQALIDRFAAPVTSVRQGFLLQKTTSATVSGTSFYHLPARAVVNGLEKLEICTTGDDSFHELVILTQPQASDYSGLTSADPTHFTLEGSGVRLFPTPDAVYPLRLHWYARPPQLIPFVSSCVVATIPTASSITTSTNPASMTNAISTSTGADIQGFDGAHELAVAGGTIASITGVGPYTITFDSSVNLERVRAGDFIRASGFAVYPTLPQELHRVLCDYTAAMIWASKGDKEKAVNLSQKAEAGINRFVSLAQPRVKTRPFTMKRRESYLRSRRSW